MGASMCSHESVVVDEVGEREERRDTRVLSRDSTRTLDFFIQQVCFL